MRHYNFLDKCIQQIDHGLNAIMGQQHSSRPNPADTHSEDDLSIDEKKHAAGLMRVNHTGEVCAQALYRGQLLMARETKTQAMLAQACLEETDHLAWTDARIRALDGHRSYLNGFWYVNSFCMGALAACVGDRWSLGFIEETEAQVAKHLEKHLGELPEQDHKSRAVVAQMHTDEVQHGQSASQAGASSLPGPVKFLMKLHAKVMTTVSYYV